MNVTLNRNGVTTTQTEIISDGSAYSITWVYITTLANNKNLKLHYSINSGKHNGILKYY